MAQRWRRDADSGRSSWAFEAGCASFSRKERKERKDSAGRTSDAVRGDDVQGHCLLDGDQRPWPNDVVGRPIQDPAPREQAPANIVGPGPMRSPGLIAAPALSLGCSLRFLRSLRENRSARTIDGRCGEIDPKMRQ